MARRRAMQGTAWGYVRFSTDKQGQNSVERQAEAIEAWAKRTGVQLLGISFDFETSRTLEHEARPGLVLALDVLRERGIGVLVAETVSRLAGDAVILGGIRKALPRGARLTTTSETGNADLDEDREDFEALFSKREIKQIRQRTKGALAMKKLRGEVVGALPYGFRRKSDGEHVTRQDGSRKCGADCLGCLHLERDDAEQEVIAHARALHAGGMSIAAVERQLRDEGITSRVGRPLIYTQVFRIVTSLVA